MKRILPLFALLIAQALWARPELSTVANDLTTVWPQGQCSHVISREVTYEMISVACVGDYSAAERNAFLDVLFTSGYFLKNETVQVGKTEGQFLYKAVHREDESPLFVKLYIRGAQNLYPDPQNSLPAAMVMITGVSRAEEVRRWNALGIPLSYSVNPVSPEVKEIQTLIEEYRQKMWVEIKFADAKPKVFNPSHLTPETVRNSEKLSMFLDAVFREDVRAEGVHLSNVNDFAKDIYALRTLLQALKDRGITRIYASTANPVLAETAEIMSLSLYATDFNLLRGNPVDKARALKIAEAQGMMLYTIEAERFDLIESGRKKLHIVDDTFRFVHSVP